MSCSLNNGFDIDCRTAVGGSEIVWFIENSKLYDGSGVSRVMDVSGTVTGLTLATGDSFKRFQVPRATANATNNGTGSQENGTFFYTHGVTLPLNKRDATTRNTVSVMAKNRLTAIVKEMDGAFRMYGKEFGLMLDSTEAGSGTAPGDRNGYMLNFTSVERDDFLIVAPNVAAALGLF